MIGRLVISFALLAGPAGALTPLPNCETAGTAESAFNDYSFVSWDSGFVAYHLLAQDETETIVIENCATRDRLRIALPHSYGTGVEAHWDANERVADRVWDLLEAERGYTLAQIGAAGEQAGGTALRDRTPYESCACRRQCG